ncbi:LOW QUALITY PROTEIN: uncharacterized protein Dyak_GE17470, partial [Drosophila yakuba]
LGTLGGGGSGGAGGTPATSLLYPGIPFILTRPNNNNIGNCKAITTTITTTTATTTTTTNNNNNNNSISANNNNNQLNNNSTINSNNNNSQTNLTNQPNTIIILQNGRSNTNNSSSTSRSPAKIYHRARSQEYGLDHPHGYQPPPLYLVTDDSSETDTVASPTGCFHFLRPGHSSAASGAVHLQRFGGSLGNSPAVGRKKHSLDSSSHHPPPNSSNSFALHNQLTMPSEDNNTYDHAFYRDVFKKMSMASSERVNSKSSGDLTMYNSSTPLTARDCDDAEEACEGGRFQRNFSGSQFPRHCFFTRQEEEGEGEADEAEVDTAEAEAEDDSQVPVSQMRQNSTTSRKSSVTFQSVSFEEPDFVTTTPRTTARSDVYTSNASISFATYRSASPSLSSSSTTASASASIASTEAVNGYHMQENSILNTRRMQDVQPHPDVIKLKEHLRAQEQRQQSKNQKKQRPKHITKSKSVEAPVVGQQHQHDDHHIDQQHQHHSAGSSKIRAFFNLFTRSRKQYSKLAEHNMVGGSEFCAIDPYQTDLAIGGSSRSLKRKGKKPQTQSCEQLERC